MVVAVVLGAVVVGAAATGWQVWGTTLLADRAAAARVSELRDEFSRSRGAEGERSAVERPETGESVWVLRIDRFDLSWPIVAGVGDDELTRGVGWYPGSAVPGQVGNCALAGHRITHGEPFSRLLELAVGDEVVVETPVATFTYSVTLAPGGLTVEAHDSWVLDPVPGEPETEPVEALLTLTTAEDIVPTADRAVGFATLTSTEPR